MHAQAYIFKVRYQHAFSIPFKSDILAAMCVCIIRTSKAISCAMKQTLHARTMCARFSLPLMPLTVAFGNGLQLTEQRNVRQRGTERRRDREKERQI